MATAKQKFDLLKAHHEAGHVVVARRLGVGVRYVTLLPEFDTDIGAHAWTESAAYKARDAEPVAFITGLANDAKVSLAGPYAQHQYRPAEDSSVISNEWGRDIEHAKRSVAGIVAIKHGFKNDLAADDTPRTLNDEEAAEAEELWQQKHWLLRTGLRFCEWRQCW